MLISVTFVDRFVFPNKNYMIILNNGLGVFSFSKILFAGIMYTQYSRLNLLSIISSKLVVSALDFDFKLHIRITGNIFKVVYL